MRKPELELPPETLAQIRPYGTRVLICALAHEPGEAEHIVITYPASPLLLTHPMRCMHCDLAPAVGLVIMGHLTFSRSGQDDDIQSGPWPPIVPGGYCCLGCYAALTQQPSLGWYQIQAEK